MMVISEITWLAADRPSALQEYWKAEINDLYQLVEFTAAEAREAEGHTKETKTVKIGVKTALEEGSVAMYWVLMNQNNEKGRQRIRVQLVLVLAILTSFPYKFLCPLSLLSIIFSIAINMNS